MKNIAVILALIVIVNVVCAQPVQAPAVGQGIDELSKNLADNTVAQKKNTKIIQDTYGKIDEDLAKWSPKITFGVCVFMLLMYLVLSFFNKIRQLKKKKSYEERIVELENMQREIIERMNERISRLDDKLSPILAAAQKVGEPETKAMRFKYLALGLVVGCILEVLFVKLTGGI